MVVDNDEGGDVVVNADTATSRRCRVSWWNGEATIEYAVDEATMTNSRRLLIVVELVVLPLSSERRDGDKVVVEWISADAERRWTIEEMSFFLVVKYVLNRL